MKKEIKDMTLDEINETLQILINEGIKMGIEIKAAHKEHIAILETQLVKKHMLNSTLLEQDDHIKKY